jgi:hypothetical protein
MMIPYIGSGISAMNTSAFSTVARTPLGIMSNEPKPDQPLDAAWIVLEAANDLGDDVTVGICRRVIDANLRGAPASPSDMDIILNYFG